jgi:pectate lyase
MMRSRCGILLAVGLLVTSLANFVQAIPAFPGADGAGMNAVGGRGGIVYHVTKLNSAIDDSQRFDFGTLRYGLDNNNFPAGVPRTIVFDVGGVFSLGRLPQDGWDPNGNGWDSQSRLTIGGTNVTFAGQTAPGAGVIFMGGGLKPQGNNNIIRNITVAAGYGMRNWWDPGEAKPEQPPSIVPPEDRGVGILPDATVYDGMDISGTNLMIDHVSTLYTTDESISMNEVANNITVQYSNISQGQNYPQWDPDSSTPHYTGHALGSLLEAGTGAAISFHHNLYAHQKSRMPQTQGGAAFYDFRNNVFYNWLGTAGARNNSTKLNLVGNFYLAGDGGEDPVGGNSTLVQSVNGGTGVLGGSNSNLYMQGNLRDTNKDGDADEGALVSGGGASSPLWSSGISTYVGVTDTADNAFSRVLNFMGANWWTRDYDIALNNTEAIDTPDERIIYETYTGNGQIMAWADDPWNNDPAEGVEWRALKDTIAASRDLDWDSEASVGYGIGDGMPTWWELEHGLDPDTRDNNGDFDADGYTNLEEYLNDVAAWPAPGPILFNASTNSRYAQITNWDANPATGVANVHNWQPSRYDTAVIDNGTVVVDAVGQHAGNILLATNASDNATLNITAGWLKVEDAPHGPSEGALVIGDNPSATAALNLSGGRLQVKTLLKGAGGSFNFTGGILSAEEVGFDLVNNGGTIAPGNSPGNTHVTGNLTVNSGILEIEIESLGSFDTVTVTGDVLLDGNLSISLLDDYEPANENSFTILTGNTVGGLFDNLSGGRVNVANADGSFLVTLGSGEVVLSDFSLESVGLPGDYNGDGKVSAADYTVWRDTLGSTTDLRANGDDSNSVIDEDDYQVWLDNYGQSSGLGTGSGSIAASVPEPTTVLLVVVGLLAITCHNLGSGASGVRIREKS